MIRDSTKSFIINLITVSRIPASLLVFFGLSDWTLFAISLWAAVTDFMDGFLARRFKLTSVVGSRLDQIADKVFHFCMLFYLTRLNVVPLYFTVLFYLRELCILAFRYFNLSDQSSHFLGKLKTFLAYSLILYLFGSQLLGFHDSRLSSIFVQVLEIVILLTAYLSLILSTMKAENRQ